MTTITSAAQLLNAMRQAATHDESARGLAIRRADVEKITAALSNRVKSDYADAGEYLDVWTTGRNEMRAILTLI